MDSMDEDTMERLSIEGLKGWDNYITKDGGNWRFQIGPDNMSTWRDPPPELEKLLLDLISSQPEDVLSWTHDAVWRLRTQELLECKELRTHQQVSISDGASSPIRPRSPILSSSGSPRACNGGFQFRNSDTDENTEADLDFLIEFRETGEITKEASKKSRFSLDMIPTEIPFRASDREQPRRSANEWEIIGTDRTDGTGCFNEHDPNRSNFIRYFGHSIYTNQFWNVRVEHSAQSETQDFPNIKKSASEAFVLNPVGRVRITWDFIYFFALLFDFWGTPMELVYFPETSGGPKWFHVCNYCILYFFCCDIVLNFFTGHVKRGSIIMAKKQIAKLYLRSWFWFDVLATVPELLFANVGIGNATFIIRVTRGMKVYKVLRAMRLLRVVRLQRTQVFLNTVIMHLELQSSFVFAMRMIQINAAILTLIHVHGIFWAALQQDWRAKHDSEAFEKYFYSMWAIAPACTFGGDIKWKHDLVTDSQRLLELAITFERINLLIFLLKWLLWRANLECEDASRSRKLEGALSYLNHHSVSPSVQFKVFQSLSEISKVQRRQQQFNELVAHSFPKQLRRLISEELWRDKLLSFDPIHYLARWNPESLTTLALAVREEILSSHTIVFTAGESSRVAYLILHGRLGVTYHETDSVVPDYFAAMWVGEKALVNSELRRNQTLVCKEWSQLMALGAQEFQTVLIKFDLKAKYEKLLRSQIFFGLCGRCGMLGEHFSHECPSIHMGVLSKTLSFTKQLKAREQGKPRELCTTNVDLRRFLEENNLLRLQKHMEKYGITSIEDLNVSALEMLRADPEVQLSHMEFLVLSGVSIKEFRKKMKHVYTRVFAQSGPEHNHLVFISHYKVEAGTEAALLQEGLHKAISENPGSPGKGLKAPVFLDSEDLKSLSDLKLHVRRSHNLLLLLTPGVLTRPWCLVEIVAAVQTGVKIVLVEVQRRDLTFHYPDEDFFQRVRGGTELGQGALEVIRREGIVDAMLENALRQTFKRIALPFSPHKTAAIRQAEMNDILKRLSLREDLIDSDEEDESKPSFASGRNTPFGHQSW